MTERDDDADDNYTINYRQMFSESNRNRRRHGENLTPKKPKVPEPESKGFAPKAIKKKVSQSSGQSRRDARQRMDDRPLRGMASVAREMIVKDISLTTDELIEKLEAQGYEAAPLTISTFRSDTRAILKIAQELKIDLQKLDIIR